MVGVLFIFFVLIIADPEWLKKILVGISGFISVVFCIVLILVVLANPKLIPIIIVLAIIDKISEKIKK